MCLGMELIEWLSCNKHTKTLKPYKCKTNENLTNHHGHQPFIKLFY